MMSNFAGECIRKIRPSPARYWMRAIIEQPDQTAVAVAQANLTEPVDLRRNNLDARDAFDLRSARDAVNRIARSQPDDRDLPRVWMQERRHHPQASMNIAVRNRALANAVDKDRRPSLRPPGSRRNTDKPDASSPKTMRATVVPWRRAHRKLAGGSSLSMTRQPGPRPPGDAGPPRAAAQAENTAVIRNTAPIAEIARSVPAVPSRSSATHPVAIVPKTLPPIFASISRPIRRPSRAKSVWTIRCRIGKLNPISRVGGRISVAGRPKYNRRKSWGS